MDGKDIHPPASYYRLSKPDRSLRGTITLDGSKSISNRALTVLALARADPDRYLQRLSTARDTTTLQRLLMQAGSEYDAGDAGTTFRFLTAYLAARPGVQVLTGSHRMRERPVGALVGALRELGASIAFLEKDGYPPLQIGEPNNLGLTNREVRIQADTSSQFLSALLMIGPYLPNGLVLIPEGPLVSRPYLEMTLRLMRYFGARADWQGDQIWVEAGGYTPRPLIIEADWSAASYWYAMAAFADDVDLHLDGLFAASWQGDSVLAKMMEQFGIHTTFQENGLHLSKSGQKSILPSVGGVSAVPPLHGGDRGGFFEWDFLDCPDLAQTLAVVCAGLGRQGFFTGLDTLAIKETDRIAALKTELAKVGVSLSKLPARFSKNQPTRTFYLLDGQAQWLHTPRFATYNDHRMAMSFAPLAMLRPIEIARPEVVTKSYPRFWEHLAAVGFVVEPPVTP